MKAETRKINTNLYSDIAYEALSSVIGQLSDGIWENSPAMNKYWMFASITRADNKQVIIEVSKEPSKYEQYGYHGHYTANAFYKMSDDEIIKWFAAKLKQIVKIEMKDEPTIGAWKRDNMTPLSYLGYKAEICVGVIYVMYDFLNGRSMNKFDNELLAKVVGEPASESEIQVAAAKREKLEAATAAYNENRKAVDEWEKAEIERIKKEAEAKRASLRTVLSDIRKKLDK